MPRGVRNMMHSGVSSIQLLGDINKEVIARPARLGHDAPCGCPGYAGTRLIDMEYPEYLAPIYSHLQWDAFLSSLNENLESTNVPDCPLELGLCLPPVCAFFWYCRRSRSKERVEFFSTRIQEENERLSRVGLMWSEAQFQTNKVLCIRRVPELKASIALQMNVTARTQYELDNPQAHQYLAQLLLQRFEKHPPATSGSSGSATPSGVRSINSGLDEAQQKLLMRQETLVRKTSRPGSSLKGEVNTSDPTMTPAVANEKWAEPTTKPTFQPILPESTITPEAPVVEQMQ